MPDVGSVSSSQPRGRDLVRAVGVLGLAASVFNLTVGGGIFRLPASAAAAAGQSAILVYLICAAVMACVVLCFAEAGSRVSLTGGPYAYVEAVFGRYVGFIAGVLLWMLSTAAVAGVSSAFAEGLGELFGIAGLRVPVIVTMFILLAAINIRGVEQGTKLIIVASIAKLLPLLVFVGVGVFFIQPENVIITERPDAANLARAAIVLVFAFTGVETALVPSGEIRDPARTVPRALAIAMIGITLLYISVHLVAAGALGDRLATANVAPLAFAAESFMGYPGRLLLLVGMSISMFGYVSGVILAIPRALYRFAEDGLLPRVVGSVHPSYRTPHVAIVIQTIIVCILAVFNSFEALAVISNLAALLLYAGCAMAAFQLRRKGVREEGAMPFRVPGGPLVPIVTVALIGWLLTSITRAEWLVMLVTIVIATAFYVVATRVTGGGAGIATGVGGGAENGTGAGVR